MDRRVLRARWAVFAAFILNGFVFANWAGRIPTVRDILGRNEAQMGGLLFIIAIGSVIALPLAGHVVDRIGAKWTTSAATAVVACGFTTVSVGLWHDSIPIVCVGLFLDGIGIAVWDVAMNLEGAAVEQRLGRSIMSQFHGGFSLGTVLGAFVAYQVELFGATVPAHLITVAAFALVAILISVRFFLPTSGIKVTEVAGAEIDPADAPAVVEAVREARADAPAGTSRRTRLFGAWLEPRTIMIGFMVMAAALTEGSANDWVALGIVDGFDLPNSVGTIGLGAFLISMTAMRMLGTRALDRLGRVPVLRLCSVFAIIGLTLYGLSPWLWLALVGVALWGLGAALGFPVGMSAAADDPARAAARLSVVSTIGYCAFLAGPPLLGLVAHVVGYRHAVLFILIPLAISFFLVPFARPLKVAQSEPSGVRG